MTQQSRNPLAARDPGRRRVVGGLFGTRRRRTGRARSDRLRWGAGADPKTVTFGSNGADATPKKAYASVTDAFAKDSGLTVKTHTVDHDTFQKSISTYLQGTPRPRLHLVRRLPYLAVLRQEEAVQPPRRRVGHDRRRLQRRHQAALRRGTEAPTGAAVQLPVGRLSTAKSLFKERGYQVPQKWSEFIALTKRMKKDGLSPIASGYGGGDSSWSILGAFDYVNLRTNGDDFHMSLMRGKVSWTDKRALATLDHWRELAPYYQQGAAGRSWQDAAQSLHKKSGMAVIGLFLGQQITDSEDTRRPRLLPLPRDLVRRARSGRRRGTHQRFHAQSCPPRTRPVPRSSWSSSAAPTPRSCTWASTRATSPSTTRRAPARTTCSRRSPPTSSPPPSRSASSRTAKITPASISTVVLPGRTEWLSHPTTARERSTKISPSVGLFIGLTRTGKV